MMPKRLIQAAWAVAILAGLAFGIEVSRNARIHSRVEQEAKLKGRAEAQAAAARIGQQLELLESIAHGVASDLAQGRVAPRTLAPRLVQGLEPAADSAAGLGVLFVPFAADPGLRLFGPYAHQDKGVVRTFQAEAGEDYTAQSWFREELSRDGWGERRFDPARNQVMVVYSERFQLPGAQAASGVVRLEVSLEDIRGIVAKSGLGVSGYGFLLSPTGVYLSDPKTDLVRNGRTILELAAERNDPGRRFIGEKALRGEPAFAQSVSGVTGQEVWIFLEPVPRARWSLGTVLIRDEVVLFPLSARSLIVRCVSLAVAWVLAALFLLLCSRQPSLRRLWGFAAAASLVLAGGTAVLFAYAHALPQPHLAKDLPILDDQGLQVFTERYGRLEVNLTNVPAVLIPTGVYLDAMEFAGHGQVKVAGRIWQKFPKDAPKEMRTGLAFPEALAGDIVPGLAKEERNGVVQFYTFQAVIKQKLISNVNYPFDQARIRLWIRPKAIWRNEILVPDFAAFQMLTPTTRPGIDRELSVSGWRITRSFYSYLLQSYSSNFGLEGYAGQQDSPELLFNFTLKRNLLNPFIATFLPLLAVLGLLFAVVMTITGNPARVQATNYRQGDFLRNTITLFFPVIVAQMNLRSTILSDQLIYVEYYYFAVYGLLLLVNVDAMAFALRPSGALAYEDNAIAKLAFWPFILACFYLISILFLL